MAKPPGQDSGTIKESEMTLSKTEQAQNVIIQKAMHEDGGAVKFSRINEKLAAHGLPPLPDDPMEVDRLANAGDPEALDPETLRQEIQRREY